MSQLVARLAQPFALSAHEAAPAEAEWPAFDVDTAVFCLVTVVCTVVLLAL
ncbi:hypothetical protein DLREEDagrD3_24330 [Denitratisoma sp. agr-D3]